MINLLILERKHALYSQDSKILLGKVTLDDLMIPHYVVERLDVLILIDTKRNQYCIIKSPQYDESVRDGIETIDKLIDKLETVI